jgi:hypothetical protein
LWGASSVWFSPQREAVSAPALVSAALPLPGPAGGIFNLDVVVAVPT